MDNKLLIASEKFLLKMKPGTVNLDTMKSNGAPLLDVHKDAIIQVAKWMIDNNDFPKGILVEICNDGKRIRKISLEGFKSVHHYFKGRGYGNG